MPENEHKWQQTPYLAPRRPAKNTRESLSAPVNWLKDSTQSSRGVLPSITDTGVKSGLDWGFKRSCCSTHIILKNDEINENENQAKRKEYDKHYFSHCTTGFMKSTARHPLSLCLKVKLEHVLLYMWSDKLFQKIQKVSVKFTLRFKPSKFLFFQQWIRL